MNTKSTLPNESFVHLARWYKHIASFEPEFSSLPGDAEKPLSAYGPDSTEASSDGNGANKFCAEDDDPDLFGSDDEEEDEEAEKLKAQRLEEYRQKKAGKTKPAAKSVVTLDIKPWGMRTQPICILQS